jgi:hypothetical protein
MQRFVLAFVGGILGSATIGIQAGTILNLTDKLELRSAKIVT